MKKRTALSMAVLAACAASASAVAAPAREGGVKDPETGITLYPPKLAASAPAGTKQQQLAAEVKAAMKRVASTPRKGASSADVAVRKGPDDKS